MSKVLDLWAGMTATVLPFAGAAAPDGWLMCSGQAVSRSTYPNLYGALCPQMGTVTISIAAPGVVTLNAHGKSAGDRIRLFTTGALPTGLTANTDYYLVSAGANTFSLATAPGGAAITTTGTQSGTHSAQYFPHGAGDGSTTFNVPDMRGRVAAGLDHMGGTASGRMTSAGAGVYGAVLGASGGSETHTLTTAQMPSHTHNIRSITATGNDSDGGVYLQAADQVSSGTFQADTAVSSLSAGSGNAHPITQPTMMLNSIIKT